MELTHQLEAFAFYYKRITFFKLPHQIEYIKQLASYMDNDVNILQALDYTAEAYELTYGADHVAVEISYEIKAASNSKEGYQAIIKKYFHPDIAVAFELIRFNNQSIEQVKEVVGLIESEKGLKKQALSQLMVPFTIFMVGLMTLTAVGGFILPMIEARTDGVVTGFEADFGRGLWFVFSNFWFVLVPALATLVVFYTRIQKNWTGKAREKADQFWPFRLYRQFCGLRFLTLTGLLKRSGCEDNDAFELISRYASPYFRSYLEQYASAFLIGEPRSKYFGHGLLDKLQIIRLRRFFSGVNDIVFSNAVIAVSKQSEQDIILSSNKVVMRWQLALMVFGFIFGTLGIGIVIDGGVLLAD